MDGKTRKFMTRVTVSDMMTHIYNLFLNIYEEFIAFRCDMGLIVMVKTKSYYDQNFLRVCLSKLENKKKY